MSESNGRIAPQILDKFLSDEIKIQIIKTKPLEPENHYGEFQAIINHKGVPIGLRTPIPKKEDFLVAFKAMLIALTAEVEQRL